MRIGTVLNTVKTSPSGVKLRLDVERTAPSAVAICLRAQDP